MNKNKNECVYGKEKIDENVHENEDKNEFESMYVKEEKSKVE